MKNGSHGSQLDENLDILLDGQRNSQQSEK